MGCSLRAGYEGRDAGAPVDRRAAARLWGNRAGDRAPDRSAGGARERRHAVRRTGYALGWPGAIAARGHAPGRDPDGAVRGGPRGIDFRRDGADRSAVRRLA